MPIRSRLLGFALAACTVALPAYSGAQNWTSQNINGLVVFTAVGQGYQQRAVQVKDGWYYETTYVDANGLLLAMQFSLPQFGVADRIDFVRDNNGDHVMDFGWTWIVGRGWEQWAPTEIVSFKRYSDQMRSQYFASAGKPEQEIYRMWVTRADKMMEAAGQMLRARSP